MKRFSVKYRIIFSIFVILLTLTIVFNENQELKDWIAIMYIVCLLYLVVWFPNEIENIHNNAGIIDPIKYSRSSVNKQFDYLLFIYYTGKRTESLNQIILPFVPQQNDRIKISGVTYTIMYIEVEIYGGVNEINLFVNNTETI